MQRQPEEEEKEDEPLQTLRLQRYHSIFNRNDSVGADDAGSAHDAHRRALLPILRSSRAQAKLAIGSPDDQYEQEADRVADEVMRTSPSSPRHIGIEGRLRGTDRASTATPLSSIQRTQPPKENEPRAFPSARAARVLERSVTSPGSGAPLYEPARSRVEPVVGADLSNVRVHDDAAAHHASRLINAKAFTHKNDIFLGSGQSPSDVQLMAHEAAHVVQQSDTDAASPSAARMQAIADSGARTTPIRNRVSPQVSRVTVNPAPAALRNRLALVGDGTTAHLGIKIKDLRPYVAQQADWFTESSLTVTDRNIIWNLLGRLESTPELGFAAGEVHVGEYNNMSPAEHTKLDTYVQGFNDAAQTIRLSTPAPNATDALKKGTTMSKLSTFVPPPVMRIVIPESGLDYLIANTKTTELQNYYTDFSPTLEHPDEWPYIEPLLTGGITRYNALRTWISDLHIFTEPTLNTLTTNVFDFSRSKPVLLVLFSATDWNNAFAQSTEMESAVQNTHNLALVLQGLPTLAVAATRASNIARDYGERDVIGIDWSSFSVQHGPGRLGQVVIAGHGSDTSVEFGVSGAAPTIVDDQWVHYPGEEVDSAANTAHTQLLINTLLKNMDPNDARIVFAGCLVGSHEFPASMNLSNTATAAATLRSHLASSQNLRDFVNARMAALGITGDVLAAMGSTPFSSFNVNPAGEAVLSNPDDINVGGAAAQYVLTGAEPEGALRAALETYADPAIGPTTTTFWMRAHVISRLTETEWYHTQTRSAYQLALPASGDVQPSKILELSHRVVWWLLAGWEDSIDVAALEGSVHAGEQATVYGGMLASEYNTEDHLNVGVQEAWMATNNTHVPNFIARLTGSALTRTTFRTLLVRPIVDPRLGTLMSVSGTPTRGQLLLALTIAAADGASMPASVKTLLRAAAGGSPTAAFPASLHVSDLLDGFSEEIVLDDIGLALGSMSTGAVDANVDLDRDSTNERFVTIAIREASVVPSVLRVREQPSMSSRTIAFLPQGTLVRVMGAIGAWSMIDHNGRVGFVGSGHIV